MNRPSDLELVAQLEAGRAIGWDVKSFKHATDLAALATTATKARWIPVDRGDFHAPRYDVVKVPVIGAPVSKAFNGDSYPCGNVAKISASLRRIETSDGTVFFRRGLSASWINDGMWSMISGHHNDRNPEF